MKIIGTYEQISSLLAHIPPEEIDKLVGGIECVYTNECRDEADSELIKERNKILCGIEDDIPVVEFNDVDLEKIYKLHEIGVLEYATEMNSEFVDFMEEHKLMRAHGYADQYGVVISGLEYNGAVTMEMVVDFTAAFHWADVFEVNVNKLYCKYEFDE